ncbi:unnamed protein product [Linum trigynum]|uniref:Uncharacterized protein n=1 Tax=Linum trigynum TaxID=586398 RepID=A0AAV2G6N1_9ROSI
MAILGMPRTAVPMAGLVTKKTKQELELESEVSGGSMGLPFLNLVKWPLPGDEKRTEGGDGDPHPCEQPSLSFPKAHLQQSVVGQRVAL